MSSSYDEINSAMVGNVWMSCGHLRPAAEPVRRDGRCPTCMNFAHFLGPWIHLR